MAAADRQVAGCLETRTDAERATVAVRNLDQVDDRTARKLGPPPARGVYNEFLISPWY